MNTANNNSRLFITLAMAVVLAVGSVMATDIYVPSFPALAQHFGVGHDLVKLTMSFYLFGIFAAQLIYGPLSDHFGRRPALLSGITITILGNVICIFAPNIYILILGRLIQGIGTAAGISIARTIGRDLLSGEQLSKVGSYISLGIAAAPAFSPLIGGYLQEYFGWQSPFVFITIYAILSAIMVLTVMPETHHRQEGHQLNRKEIMANYKELITDRRFLAYALFSGIAFAATITYFTLTPFLLQSTLHISAIHYGWLGLSITVVAIPGRLLNILLVDKLKIHGSLVIGILLMCLGAIIMLIAALTSSPNIITIVAPMCILTLGTCFIYSNAMAAAFTPFGHIAGQTGALYGALQLFTAFTVSTLASLLPNNSTIPLALVLTGLALTSGLIYLTMIKDTFRLARQRYA